MAALLMAHLRSDLGVLPVCQQSSPVANCMQVKSCLQSDISLACQVYSPGDTAIPSSCPSCFATLTCLFANTMSPLKPHDSLSSGRLASLPAYNMLAPAPPPPA